LVDNELYLMEMAYVCGPQGVCEIDWDSKPHFCDVIGRDTTICQFFERCKGACAGYGASSDLCQSCVHLASREEFRPIFNCCDRDSDRDSVCAMVREQSSQAEKVCDNMCLDMANYAQGSERDPRTLDLWPRLTCEESCDSLHLCYQPPLHDFDATPPLESSPIAGQSYRYAQDQGLAFQNTQCPKTKPCRYKGNRCGKTVEYRGWPACPRRIFN
jgi:hypothetical protein